MNTNSELLSSVDALLKDNSVSDVLEAVAIHCFQYENVIHPAPPPNANFDLAGKNIIKMAWYISNKCNL